MAETASGDTRTTACSVDAVPDLSDGDATPTEAISIIVVIIMVIPLYYTSIY